MINNITLPIVALIMGSQTDWETMKFSKEILSYLKIPHTVKIISAHRTPDRMTNFAKQAEQDGLQIIIAGAGGAAHLPGMTASYTPLPVIGVPVKSSNSIDGWDSVLSILQMPSGVPVATVALDGARNAGILAAQIMACSDPVLLERIILFKNNLKLKVEQATSTVENHTPS